MVETILAIVIMCLSIIIGNLLIRNKRLEDKARSHEISAIHYAGEWKALLERKLEVDRKLRDVTKTP